jgi:hypothetical protein
MGSLAGPNIVPVAATLLLAVLISRAPIPPDGSAGGAFDALLPGPAPSTDPLLGLDASAGDRQLFGMDAGSVDEQTAAGAKPDFGTYWVGPWTLQHGWKGPDDAMDSLVRQGVTPAVHLYYWGDDMSITCLEEGCDSALHGVRKDRDQWMLLVNDFVGHLQAHGQDRAVLVILESEFNKGHTPGYEPLDGMLADVATRIKAGYPEARVVLGFGNWYPEGWTTFDRAVEASDAVGLQAIVASTRDDLGDADELYQETLEGARRMKDTFGKPVVIHDVAVSSYPEPRHRDEQALVLRAFFDGIGALQEAGVEGIIYRSWKDTEMSSENHFGQAEDHWGLTSGDGTGKPARDVWVAGVRQARGIDRVGNMTSVTPLGAQGLF